jgi:hypothetical protein
MNINTVTYVGGPMDGRVEVVPDLNPRPIYGPSETGAVLLGRYVHGTAGQRGKMLWRRHGCDVCGGFDVPSCAHCNPTLAATTERVVLAIMAAGYIYGAPTGGEDTFYPPEVVAECVGMISTFIRGAPTRCCDTDADVCKVCDWAGFHAHECPNHPRHNAVFIIEKYLLRVARESHLRDWRGTRPEALECVEELVKEGMLNL